MPSWWSATTSGSSPRSGSPDGCGWPTGCSRRRAHRWCEPLTCDLVGVRGRRTRRAENRPIPPGRYPVPRPALLAHDLVRTPGGRRFLDGVCFTVSPGQRIGLIGENGVGKSTLLRLLAGVDEPDAGSISRPRDVGFVQQEMPFDAQVTLGAVLDAALREAHEELTQLDRIGGGLLGALTGEQAGHQHQRQTRQDDQLQGADEQRRAAHQQGAAQAFRQRGQLAAHRRLPAQHGVVQLPHRAADVLAEAVEPGEVTVCYEWSTRSPRGWAAAHIAPTPRRDPAAP
ncbi:ATP-binding cassette domain-containing protein [Streptomyces sp. NPDC058864]